MRIAEVKGTLRTCTSEMIVCPVDCRGAAAGGTSWGPAQQIRRRFAHGTGDGWGDLVVIPGTANRVFGAVLRTLPAALARRVSIVSAERRARPRDVPARPF